MATSQFNPNRLTFDEGLKRIDKAISVVGASLAGRILTSRDDDVAKVTESLRVNNIPGGFEKWQLPVHLANPSQLFISTAGPFVRVPLHSHKEGDGMRFIVSGSILYKDQELTAGDWMYIPAGHEYEFEVGRFGVTMCYCYCCCCA